MFINLSMSVLKLLLKFSVDLLSQNKGIIRIQSIKPLLQNILYHDNPIWLKTAVPLLKPRQMNIFLSWTHGIRLLGRFRKKYQILQFSPLLEFPKIICRCWTIITSRIKNHSLVKKLYIYIQWCSKLLTVFWNFHVL